MNGNDCGDTSNAGVHQTDWRLPNIKELQSLIDIQNQSPALPDGHPFSAIVSNWYWSSTTYVVLSDLAWIVYFVFGDSDIINKTSSYYIWPVRGGS